MRRPLQVLVGILSCVVFVSSGVEALGRQTKGSSVKVTYVVTMARLDGNEPNEPSRTTTSWYTPQGYRMDTLDGDVYILLKSPKLFYVLKKEEKLAMRTDAALARSLQKAMTSGELKEAGRVFTEAVRGVKQAPDTTSRFLGRSCRVSRSTIKLTGPGVTAKVETWNAEIAGHQVMLRTAYYAYVKGYLASVNLQEAVDVQIVQKPPAGLLDVPKEYTVKNFSADEMRALLKALTEAMKKPAKPATSEK
jgi:hypothetical protein